MKRIVLLIVGCWIGVVANAQTELTLWYRSPAKVWEEALPVGNGRLGAMVFGDTQRERIQFNENTLYSGEPETKKEIYVPARLAQIRQLLKENRNPEAEQIIQKEWVGRLNEAYQPFGDVYIDFNMSGEVTDYVHSLDMEEAIVTTAISKTA